MVKPFTQKALVELVEKTGLGARGFAREVGIDWTQFTRYYTHGKPPRKMVIDRIRAKYPEFLLDNDSPTAKSFLVEVVALRKETADLRKIIDLLEAKIKVDEKEDVFADVTKRILEFAKNQMAQTTIVVKKLLEMEEKVTTIQKNVVDIHDKVLAN